jgi:hypothetical protein
MRKKVMIPTLLVETVVMDYPINERIDCYSKHGFEFIWYIVYFCREFSRAHVNSKVGVPL